VILCEYLEVYLHLCVTVSAVLFRIYIGWAEFHVHAVMFL